MVRCQIFLFFWALVVAVVCAVVHSHREGELRSAYRSLTCLSLFECCDLDNFYTTLFSAVNLCISKKIEGVRNW